MGIFLGLINLASVLCNAARATLERRCGWSRNTSQVLGISFEVVTAALKEVAVHHHAVERGGG